MTLPDYQIELLVDQAHQLFDKTSIFEVFDMTDRREIIRTLVDFYGLVEVGKVDTYIRVLGQLRDEFHAQANA